MRVWERKRDLVSFTDKDEAYYYLYIYSIESFVDTDSPITIWPVL